MHQKGNYLGMKLMYTFRCEWSRTLDMEKFVRCFSDIMLPDKDKCCKSLESGRNVQSDLAGPQLHPWYSNDKTFKINWETITDWRDHYKNRPELGVRQSGESCIDRLGLRRRFLLFSIGFIRSVNLTGLILLPFQVFLDKSNVVRMETI